MAYFQENTWVFIFLIKWQAKVYRTPLGAASGYYLVCALPLTDLIWEYNPQVYCLIVLFLYPLKTLENLCFNGVHKRNWLKRDSDTGFFSVNFTKFFRTHNSVFFQTINKNIPQKSLTNKRTCPCSKPVIKKMNLGAYCIFAAGGALVPTQEKKNLGVY